MRLGAVMIFSVHWEGNWDLVKPHPPGRQYSTGQNWISNAKCHTLSYLWFSKLDSQSRLIELQIHWLFHCLFSLGFCSLRPVHINLDEYCVIWTASHSQVAHNDVLVKVDHMDRVPGAQCCPGRLSVCECVCSHVRTSRKSPNDRFLRTYPCG